MASGSEQKKLKIGWFSFSCCEDSTIMMTEILNDHYQEWFKLLDVRNAKILRRSRPLEEHLDVAFVEGAINSHKQEAELKKIREHCTKLVAIGSCAVTSMPSGHRNLFDEARQKETEAILTRFDYQDKVKKLADIVKVDAQVPGCPMDEKMFVDTVNTTLKEFNII
ncbi:MAG: hypothetical protein AAB490_00130 [Patescibacteria group bacterium]